MTCYLAGSITFQPIYGYVAKYFGKSYIAFNAIGDASIGLIFTFILFRIIQINPFKNPAKE